MFARDELARQGNGEEQESYPYKKIPGYRLIRLYLHNQTRFAVCVVNVMHSTATFTELQ